MRKLIVLLLMFVACKCKSVSPVEVQKDELDWRLYWGSSATPPSPDPIVADAQKRAVSIVSADGACSGGIGATGVIVTASHCYPKNAKNKDIFVNGQLAKVLYNSNKPDGDDIMFLHIYTEDVKPLDFAEPHVDDEVFIVMTQNQYRGIVKHGKITAVGEDMFFVDIWGIPGCSGSPIYTKDGKMVGLLTQIQAGMLRAVSAHKIQEALNKGATNVP